MSWALSWAMHRAVLQTFTMIPTTCGHTSQRSVQHLRPGQTIWEELPRMTGSCVSICSSQPDRVRSGFSPGAASRSEQEWVDGTAEKSGVEPGGPWWPSSEGWQNVLKRIQPKIDEIKARDAKSRLTQ